MKIKPADSSFSKCVRERSDWTCERCGKKYEENSQGLHCSHVFSRRYRTIRWAGDNAQALCFCCHQWYGGNPIEGGRWAEEVLGEGKVQSLIERRDEPVNVSKIEEKEIDKHYKNELKLLKEQRKNGRTGRIEFTSWQ